MCTVVESPEMTILGSYSRTQGKEALQEHTVSLQGKDRQEKEGDLAHGR